MASNSALSCVLFLNKCKKIINNWKFKLTNLFQKSNEKRKEKKKKIVFSIIFFVFNNYENYTYIYIHLKKEKKKKSP